MADFELEELRPGPLRSVKIRLYLSHFLSTWNSRVFEFGAVLYLATIFPNTLLPMSIYAVARAASAIMFSPAVGRYIDTKDRLHVVRLSIVLQRVVVAISCLTFWFLESNNTLANYVQYLTLVLLSILACVEKLCSVMNLVAVERDWVIIVVGDDMDTLATLNAQMRRIDLLCKLVGPLLIAFFDGLSTRLAIQVNLGMNVISIPLEYFAIAVVSLFYHFNYSSRLTYIQGLQTTSGFASTQGTHTVSRSLEPFLTPKLHQEIDREPHCMVEATRGIFQESRLPSILCHIYALLHCPRVCRSDGDLSHLGGLQLHVRRHRQNCVCYIRNGRNVDCSSRHVQNRPYTLRCLVFDLADTLLSCWRSCFLASIISASLSIGACRGNNTQSCRIEGF